MSGCKRGRRPGWILIALTALTLGNLSPALAHGGKKHNPMAQQTGHQPAVGGNMTTGPQDAPATAAQQPSPMMDNMDMTMDMDRSKMSFIERLTAWYGRLHPAIVRFPIAFLPAAWFTAIVGRRRPAFAAPVQFLVVAGGIFAPIAALAGWITAADADPSGILTFHRWLEVAVGLAGLLLGRWAWRRPWEDRGAGMIAALAVMMIAILVQVGLGATITQGLEHLAF